MAIYKNLDFLNSNLLRNYPIKEGLTKISTDGIFTIPDNFIADFILCASSNVDRKFYVAKIINLPDEITVEVNDDTDTLCGTFVITVSSHSEYKTYYMTASYSYAGANGKLVVGVLDNMAAAPTGVFEFELETTEFETRTIIPYKGTVNRIVFVDEKGAEFSVTGDVKIVARNNLRFRNVSGAAVLDAGDGLGLNKNCSGLPDCIRTINNESPDGEGNFTILTSDCASLEPLTSSGISGLMLSDTCCKPCLGCEEISTLTDRLVQLESDLLKLRDHYNSLNDAINQFSTLLNFETSCEL